jgi:hypothetical protein
MAIGIDSWDFAAIVPYGLTPSHLALSVAVQFSDVVPELVSVTYSFVDVLPKSSASGETENVVPDVVKSVEVTSTGEEDESQLAATTAHTTTMAARNAQHMDDFT